MTPPPTATSAPTATPAPTPAPTPTPNQAQTAINTGAVPAPAAVASPDLSTWIGRQETATDTVAPTPVRALSATLDHPPASTDPGVAIPALWHWLYFLPLHRQAEIGADGHAKRGGFLPPVALPRRMWAGGQLAFRAPIRIGDRISRTSTIEAVSSKEGRSGSLVFVKVRHELTCNGATEPALIEFHDIVYREAQRAGEVAPPPRRPELEPSWQREIVPDEVLLFRYSALTFNGHRIHYDRRYVTEIEGYPGLIVHGPLIATLLLDLVRRQLPQAELASFRFTALRPLFDLPPCRVNGRLQDRDQTVRLWASDHEGWLAMDATAQLR